MILLIDNYDSFTYNIYQYLCQLNQRVKVVRNDQTTLSKITKMAPDAIILSPGPGHPRDAGICLEVIENIGPQIPILGVCLGHQAIGMAFGAEVIKAPVMMHGKTSEIKHSRRGLYSGIACPMEVTRYHSLIIDRNSLPKSLKVTSETADGVIMGVKHKRFPIEGVQFHPESYLTKEGMKLFDNFCNRI